MNSLKLYPAFKHAALEILNRVESEGYGILITHEELHDWLDIELAETAKEERKRQWQILSQMEQLKELLLKEHNILLINSIGKGYHIPTPDNQVYKGWISYVEKAKKNLIKAQETLMYVNIELLSKEGMQCRQKNMHKMEMIKNGLTKKSYTLISSE